MGLLHNLILSVVHLAISLCDLLVLMVLLRFIYSRWPVPWLSPWAKASEPCLKIVLDYFYSLSSLFGKKLSETTQLNLLMLAAWLAKWLIISAVSI